jgi:hypothetical protein
MERAARQIVPRVAVVAMILVGSGLCASFALASSPSAPTGVGASPATGQALVRWTAPASNGGSAITGYTITPHIGASAQPAVHVANGSATSQVVTGLTNGTAYTFTVAATNGQGTGAASASSAAVTPEDTILDFAGTPLNIDSGDPSSTEVGVKFTADTGGQITGIRFYKSTANTGTHTGSLWDASGNLLAQATFTNETPSGWQYVLFAKPVPIAAGTTYVAAYFTPAGHYSSTTEGLANSIDNGQLQTVADSTSANGVYSYASSPTFPNTSFQANNYWVDVLFSHTNTSPSVPTSVGATPGYGSATVTWTAPYDGGSPITSYTVTPYVGSAPQPPTTVTGAPPGSAVTINGLTDGTTYTFTVAAANALGTSAPSTLSNAVTPGRQSQGVWSPLMNWPLVAVHSTLMYTGNIVTWDAYQIPAPSQEFDPSTNTFTSPVNAPNGVFCSAMAQLPDGRILVVGGYGAPASLGVTNASIYDPATSTWTPVAPMKYLRWYPGLAELANGKYLALSGNSTDGETWSNTPEVYDPSSNTWTVLKGVSTPQIQEQQYPHLHLLPNGNVLVIGQKEGSSYQLNVAHRTWTEVGGDIGTLNGASIMYRPGKILYAGGAPSIASQSDTSGNADTIDMTSSTPTWKQIASMHYPRAYHSMVMLANGTVMVEGGEPVAGNWTGQAEVSGGVLPAEIWNPGTGQWTTEAPMGATRGYHTSMLLLPDARVLVAGSGHRDPGDPGQYSAQVYSPPYLFNGPRPTIASAPAAAAYGSTIAVQTPQASSIRAVNLVDMGASTHQQDFDQHFVPLRFRAGSGTLSVKMPTNPNNAPPGNYMLFLIGAGGVPSVASLINVSATATPPAAVQQVTARPVGATAALVSWVPQSGGSSPIRSYTVTPYIGSSSQAPTIVSGVPAPTQAIVHGLRPGLSYTFRVTATNDTRSGPASRPTPRLTPAATASPALVQRAAAYADRSAGLPLALRTAPAPGDRLVVEASVWGRDARAATVTDSAGDHYTELLTRRAPDGTELSVWTAPVTSTRGSRRVIRVVPSAEADVGAVAVEYSGLSSARGPRAVDSISSATGDTHGAALVHVRGRQGARADRELAVGVYADSGSGDVIRPGRGWTARVDTPPTHSSMQMLIEDRVLRRGVRPRAATGIGPRTSWLMGLVVFRVFGDRARARAAPPTRAAPIARDRSRAGAPPTLPVPLSRRRRSHPIAGSIKRILIRKPNGQLVHFYCLIGDTGAAIPSSAWLTLGKPAFTEAPARPG